MLALQLERALRFPRLRYMGSKYRLLPDLIPVFAELGGTSALDGFCGSGVVAYALKSLGFAVTASDFLAFPSIIAAAVVENDRGRLDEDDIDRIAGPARDDRDFIRRTFDGLYFTADDREFLDSAWSHIDVLTPPKRHLAIAALVLAAARKQPRGVFTFSELRYDDGRRSLRLPLRQLFVEAAREYSAAVFDGGVSCRSVQADIFEVPAAGYDVVYLDPPYAPPRDDNCYIKRYHFLEGLAVYWRGQAIRDDTKTKKLAKRYTPFSYKHTVIDALARAFRHFAESTIVLSYSSNAVPDASTIEKLLRAVKQHVDVVEIEHRYSFGTHDRAKRRGVTEYVFVAR